MRLQKQSVTGAFGSGRSKLYDCPAFALKSAPLGGRGMAGLNLSCPLALRLRLSALDPRAESIFPVAAKGKTATKAPAVRWRNQECLLRCGTCPPRLLPVRCGSILTQTSLRKGAGTFGGRYKAGVMGGSVSRKTSFSLPVAWHPRYRPLWR